MRTKIKFKVSRQRLGYRLSLKGFLIILISSCVYTAPIFKNYQGSEVSDDQIAIIETSIHINRIYDFKDFKDSQKEPVYSWKRDGDFRQARLIPGDYLIELVSNKPTAFSGQVRPYSVTHLVNLQAGHKYQTYSKIVDSPYPFGPKYIVWIEDKTK
jgi:hypothetical protein